MQTLISLSTTEAEYIALSSALREVIGLMHLISELQSRGFRLNIPAGTAVRFEAGDSKRIELVALAGSREVYGLNALINGPLDRKPARRKPAPARAARRR